MSNTGSSTVYHIDVQDQDSTAIANAYGSLKVITLVAKEAAEEITGAGPYTVTLVEVERIAGDVKRAVLSLTADGDIVTTVLKRRLASERKNGAEHAEPATEEYPERPALEPTSGEESELEPVDNGSALARDVQV
jgi:hypothetical protein